MSQTGSAPARWMDPSRNDVTDIIPFDEFGGISFADIGSISFADFGDLDDPDFTDDVADTAFGKEAQVLRAPELDDLHDEDDPAPLCLLPAADPEDATDVVPVRGGQHRKPVSNQARNRILVGAMAAGAIAAAGHSALFHSGDDSARTVLAAEQTPLGGDGTRGVQLVSIKASANAAVHDEEFARGSAFAQERAEREARLQRPLFVMPVGGMFTSNYGYRWGALHGGIDLANPIGTPILAVSDGVVIEAGPAAGYGALVKLRHFDGTVTLYGHVNTTTVSVGQRVMAGDQIATVGNRGDSTGPHLHFEVLLAGTQRIDPLPWLARRGLTV